MDHSFENLDRSLDLGPRCVAQTCDDITGSVIDISTGVDCRDRAHLYKSVTTGKSTDTCLHSSVHSQHLADRSSCTGAVIAGFKFFSKCIPDSVLTHLNIRENITLSDCEIEQRSTCNDWYSDITYSEALTSFSKRSHYARSCFKSKSRSAAEYNCIDLIYSVFRSEQIRFSCCRASASYIHACHSSSLCDDNCDSGACFSVFSIAKPEAFYFLDVDLFQFHKSASPHN